MNKFRTSNEASPKRGKLIVISGPSGTGKGTIVRRLLQNRNAELSVSCTTRAPRDGEVDGKDYHFLTPELFEHMEAEGGFLESAEVFGHRYGTPRANIERTLAEGRDVLLEIDVQGAMQIKERFPEAVLVFIKPPSEEELRRRLTSRGTETEEQIRERLGKAQAEIAQADNYDYVVVNDDLAGALAEIGGILDASGPLTREEGERNAAS